MGEHNAMTVPQHEPQSDARRTSAPTVRWASRLLAYRWTQALIGVAALVLLALAFSVPLQMIFFFGLLFLCPLMMLGMHGGHHDPVDAHDTAGGATRHRALDIVQERYARGELSREQYEEMRRDLSS